MTDGYRSRWHWIKCATNPLDSTAGFALPHLVVILLLIGVGSLISYERGRSDQRTYDAAYYLQTAHIKLNGFIPPDTTPLALSPITPVRSTTGAVIWKYFNTKPENQGSVGQCQCFSWDREYEYAFYRATGKQYHFSCRFLYGLLMFQRYGGRDVGSNFGDYGPLLSQYGAPRIRDYGYVGVPSTIDYPPPAAFIAAAPHRYGITEHLISNAVGGGTGLIQRIEWALHYHHPVDQGILVTGQGTGGILDANANGGFVDAPLDRHFADIGGHAITLVEYDRNLCHTSQWGETCGFFKAKNQWLHFGLNRLGQPSDSGNFFYISYRYIAQYSDGAAWLSVHKNTPPQAGNPPAWHQPPPSQNKPIAPPSSFHPKNTLCFGCDQWVYRVIANDTGRDMAPYINTVARQTGLTATGVAAVIYAECGFFTTSPRCDREAGGLDFSYGCCQITISTASEFGVGTGYFDGHWGPNASYVRNYEDDISRGIPLAGRVLNSYRQYELRAGCPSAAQLPQLYVAWNAGPAQPCGFLLYPGGQAGVNYYGNFLGAYRYAESFGRSTNPYGPTPRKRVIVCGKRLSLRYHRRGGFWFAHLWYCNRWTWPKYHWKQKTVVTWRKR